MRGPEPSAPVVDAKLESPRHLELAGGLLFALGLGAAFLVYVQSSNADQSRMVLNAAVLLSLGYPMLLYVRALKKIAALERRIRVLEHPSASETAQGHTPAGER